MPEVILQRNRKKFEATQVTSIAYGDKYIEDNPPCDYPYTGAWNIRALLLQQDKVLYIDMPFKITAAVNQAEGEVLTVSWNEKKDPFTQEDLLDSTEDQIQEYIFRIRALPAFPYKESLASRLLTLFNYEKEEDPVSIGIAVGSLRNFYNFLRLNPHLKNPVISLTPDNNIYASWRSEQNQVFSIHFLANDDARFVIFKPNDRHPERQMRISGTATTDILMETVVPYGVLDWIAE